MNFSFFWGKETADRASLPPRDVAGQNLPARVSGRGLLASSHAGTRLPIASVCLAQGAPPRPAAALPGRAPLSPPFKGSFFAKNRGNACAALPRKDPFLASYGGIIRIRSRVEVERLPLSPLTSSPVFASLLYRASVENARVRAKLARFTPPALAQRGWRAPRPAGSRRWPPRGRRGPGSAAAARRATGPPGNSR